MSSGDSGGRGQPSVLLEPEEFKNLLPGTLVCKIVREYGDPLIRYWTYLFRVPESRAPFKEAPVRWIDLKGSITMWGARHNVRTLIANQRVNTKGVYLK